MENAKQPQDKQRPGGSSYCKHMACFIPSVHWLRREKSVTTATTPASNGLKLNREFCEQNIATSLKRTAPSLHS